MGFQGSQVADLASGKARLQEGARVLPFGPVGDEDAVSEDGGEGSAAGTADLEVFELGRQDGLDVVGLDGTDDGEGGQSGGVGVAVDFVVRLLFAEEGFAFDGADGVVDDIEAEDWIPERIFRWELASIFRDSLSSRGIDSELPAYVEANYNREGRRYQARCVSNHFGVTVSAIEKSRCFS